MRNSDWAASLALATTADRSAVELAVESYPPSAAAEGPFAELLVVAAAVSAGWKVVSGEMAGVGGESAGSSLLEVSVQITTDEGWEAAD
jgi:hypothetical protein